MLRLAWVLVLVAAAAVVQADLEGQLRLTNSPQYNEGILQYYHDGEWIPIIDFFFDYDALSVACRQLGYDDYMYIQSSNYYAPVPYTSYISEVDCVGTEASMSECELTFTEGTTFFGYQIGIVCSSTLAEIDLEFSFGGGYEHEGLVQVKFQNEWGMVCAPTEWTEDEARTVCASMGFYGGNVTNAADYSPETFKFWITDVVCYSDSATFADCSYDGYRVDSCLTPAAIVCDPNLPTPYIIGIAVGAVALVLILIIICCCCCKKKKRESDFELRQYNYDNYNPTISAPVPTTKTPQYSATYAVDSYLQSISYNKTTDNTANSNAANRAELFGSLPFQQAVEDSKYDQKVHVPEITLATSSHLSNFQSDMSALNKRSDQEINYFAKQREAREAELERSREELRKQEEARKKELEKSAANFKKAVKDSRYYDKSHSSGSEEHSEVSSVEESSEESERSEWDDDSEESYMSSETSLPSSPRGKGKADKKAKKQEPPKKEPAKKEFGKKATAKEEPAKPTQKKEPIKRSGSDSKISSVLKSGPVSKNEPAPTAMQSKIQELRLQMEKRQQQLEQQKEKYQTTSVPAPPPPPPPTSSFTTTFPTTFTSSYTPTPAPTSSYIPTSSFTPTPAPTTSFTPTPAPTTSFTPRPAPPSTVTLKSDPPEKTVPVISDAGDSAKEAAISELLKLIQAEYSERNKEVLIKEFIKKNSGRFPSKQVVRVLEKVFSPFTQISLLKHWHPKISDPNRVDEVILQTLFDSDYERDMARKAIQGDGDDL